MKRLFACFLVLALMLSIAPISVFAEEPAVADVPVIETAPAEAAAAPVIETAPAEKAAPAQPAKAELQATGTCGDNLTWTLNDGTLRISGTGPMYDYVSTTCPWSGSMYASSVKHVVVESGVTTIGNYAFNVYGIETVSLPDTLTSIGKDAFLCNRKMESITIPEGVTSVGVAAFEGCEALKSVYLPDSLTVIPEEIFDGCPLLESVRLGNCVTEIQKLAFSGAQSLNNVVLPDTVKTIGYYAFLNCQSLSSITLNEGLETIGDNCFQQNYALEEIYIPASVTNIGLHVFRSSPTNITVDPYNTTYSALEGVLFEGTHYEKLKHCPESKTGTYVLPRTTTSIAQYGMIDCKNLTKVVFSPVLETVGLSGLDACKGLETLVIHAGLKSAGSWAFKECDNLSTVIFCGTPTEWSRIDFGGKSYCNDAVKYATPQYHSWIDGVVVTPATCEEDGVQAAVCEYCHTLNDAAPIPATGHAWDAGVKTADPTCTAPGEILHTCGNDASHTYVEYTPAALGHDLVHHEGKTTTCTEAGWREYDTCTRCDYTTKVEIPAYGHYWDRGVVTTEPTETTAGVRTYTCLTCQATREEVIPAQHTHNFSEEITKSPSCTETGLRTYTCTCGYSYTEVIPADGHNMSKIDEVPATYETEGVKAHWACSVCHKLFLLGADGGVMEVQAADLVIPKLHEHNYNETITKPASCKEPGLKTFTCTICGASYTEVIPQTAHSLKHVEAKAATTEQEGNIEYWQCEICGAIFTDAEGTKEATYKEVLIPKLHTHSYSSKVTKEATCTEDGEKTYTCACGSTYSEPIPATGHILKHIPAQEATAEQNGNHEYWQCEKCGKLFLDAEGKTETTEKDVIIPKLGGHTHSYTVTETKAPTCTEAGFTKYTCACGDSYTDPIPATGHSLKHVELVHATDKTDGCKEHWVCEKCGKLFLDAEGKTETTAKDLVIPKLIDPSAPTVTVASVTARPGETVDVAFDLSNNTGIAGAILSLAYDSRLTVTKITAGSALSGLTFTKPGDLTANPLTLVWDGLDPDATNGTILTVTFAVASDAPDGDCAVTVAYEPGGVYDGDLNNLDVAVVNGKITVQNLIPGDLTGDKKINAKDITFLRRFLAGGFGVALSDSSIADLNKDGEANAKDITLLRRFIVGGYDVVLG